QSHSSVISLFEVLCFQIVQLSCFVANRKWICFVCMVCISCKVIFVICFSEAVLSICSRGDNYTCFALDLLCFCTSKPDCKFCSSIFVLGSFVYAVSKTINNIVFFSVECRNFYTINFVFN